MAVKVLTVANAKPFDTLVTATPEAATVAADGFEATVDGDILVIVQNVSANTNYDITFEYGNAMQGVEDFTEEIAFGVTKVFKMSTGKYKNLSGTSKGKILITPEHVDVKVKVIEL